MALVNSSTASKKEILLFFNTLCGLVKNLERRYTTVDLRNECCVTGKIIKVDGFMNVEMEDVVFYDMRGNSKPLTNFYVSARTIRNVHIPKNADAITLLKGQLDSMTRKKNAKPVRRFKTVQAKKRTAKTVQEAYKSGSSKEG